MSKRRDAPKTEPVCPIARFAEAERGAVEDILIAWLLTEGCAMLEQASASVGELNRQLDSVQRQIETGELRRQVEAETREWLADNRDVLIEFRNMLEARGHKSPIGARSPSGDLER